MRYWERNFDKTGVIIFGVDLPIKAHSGICDEMLWQSSSNYHLFGCVLSGIYKRNDNE